MIDKQIQNLLRVDSFDDKLEFQHRILKYLRKNFPAYTFSADRNPELISFYVAESGEGQFGLANLRALFLASAQRDIDLRELTQEHFRRTAGAFGAWSGDVGWETAKSSILPQLANDSLAVSLAPTIDSVRFAKDLSVVLVLDSEETFRYLDRQQAEKWDIPFDELLETAVSNLAVKCADIPLTLTEPPEFAAIQTFDSFDAVKIMIPAFRDQLFELFGEPFCFGVPNRDFLICWVRNASKAFHLTILNQIARDYKTQPYKLSRFGYLIDGGGKVRLLTNNDL